MENLFDVLCSSLNELELKKMFLASEGVDLMVLMMKCVFSPFKLSVTYKQQTTREKNQSSLRSIKVLDYCMSGRGGSAACETFVEALGLKTLFAALMGKAMNSYTYVDPVLTFSPGSKEIEGHKRTVNDHL